MNAILDIITANNTFPSPYTGRVQMLCHEKNLDYQLTFIDPYHKPKWFMEMTSLGQVPVLRVGSLVIPDSYATMIYIDSIKEPKFIPDDPALRAQQYAEIFYANEIAAAIMHIIKVSSTKASEFSKLDKLLAGLEKTMQGPYVKGENFSLLDIVLIGHMHWLAVLEQRVFPFSLLKKYSKICLWYQHMLERPSFKKVYDEKTFADNFIAALKEKNLLEKWES